jgi:hypothetical protein
VARAEKQKTGTTLARGALFPGLSTDGSHADVEDRAGLALGPRLRRAACDSARLNRSPVQRSDWSSSMVVRHLGNSLSGLRLTEWGAASEGREQHGFRRACGLTTPRFRYRSTWSSVRCMILDALALECDTFLTIEQKLPRCAEHLFEDHWPCSGSASWAVAGCSTSRGLACSASPLQHNYPTALEQVIRQCLRMARCCR